MSALRMSPVKLGWCLDNHHSKCWRVSVTGAYCACACHTDESGKPKEIDAEPQTPAALIPFLAQQIDRIRTGDLTVPAHNAATPVTASSPGEPAPTTEGSTEMTENPEVTPVPAPAEAPVPEAAPAPAEAPIIPSVPSVETETLADIEAEAEAPEPKKPRKSASAGGTSLAALKQLSREELNERREKHVKHAALPTKTAEWHAKQVVKIDGILGRTAE